MKKLLLVVLGMSIFGCKSPEPRFPVTHSSGSFIKASAERNIKLFEAGKDLIWQKLALDTSAAVLQSILSKPVMTQMEKQTKADMDVGVMMRLLVALIRFAKILL